MHTSKKNSGSVIFDVVVICATLAILAAIFVPMLSKDHKPTDPDRMVPRLTANSNKFVVLETRPIPNTEFDSLFMKRNDGQVFQAIVSQGRQFTPGEKVNPWWMEFNPTGGSLIAILIVPN